MGPPCMGPPAGTACAVTLNLVLVGVDLLQQRNAECSSLAGAVFGSSQDVTPRERDGDGLLLNWGGRFEALLEDPHEQPAWREGFGPLKPSALAIELLTLALGSSPRRSSLSLR